MVTGKSRSAVSDRILLLTGKDTFLKEKFIQDYQSKQFAAGEDQASNTCRLTAGEEPVAGLLSFLQSAPFLSGARLAVLRRVEDANKKEKESLLTAIASLPSWARLVLVSEESTAKKDTFLKKLAEQVKVVTCHPPFERDLPGWIRQCARGHGLSLEGALPGFLMERVGKETVLLDTALQQLALYVYPAKSVTVAQAEQLFGHSASEDIFELLDLLVAKNAQAALRALRKLMQEGVRGVELVGVMASQLTRLRNARALLDAGKTPRDVGAALRVHQFFVERFVRQAKALSREESDRAMAALLDCDIAIKTGQRTEPAALDELLFRLCA